MYEDIIYINGSDSDGILQAVANTLNLDFDGLSLKNDNWEITISENDAWGEVDGAAGYKWLLEVDCKLKENEYKQAIQSMFSQLHGLTKYISVSWDFENDFPELSIDRKLPIVKTNNLEPVVVCMLILLGACIVMVILTYVIMEIVRFYQ